MKNSYQNAWPNSNQAFKSKFELTRNTEDRRTSLTTPWENNHTNPECGTLAPESSGSECHENKMYAGVAWENKSSRLGALRNNHQMKHVDLA